MILLQCKYHHTFLQSSVGSSFFPVESVCTGVSRPCLLPCPTISSLILYFLSTFYARCLQTCKLEIANFLNYLGNMTFLLALLLGLCLYFSLKNQLRATFSWKLPRPSAPHPPEWVRWPSHILLDLTLVLLSVHLPVLFHVSLYLSVSYLPGNPSRAGIRAFCLSVLGADNLDSTGMLSEFVSILGQFFS